MTAAEKKLWYDYLKKLDVNVLRQKPIDHYIVDFYIPKYLLVIEVDGEIHDSVECLEYDAFRDTMLQFYGLNVIRIRNEKIIDEYNSVVEKIEEHLGTVKKKIHLSII